MESTIKSIERSSGAEQTEEPELISITEVAEKIHELMRGLHPNATPAQHAVAADFSADELNTFIQTYWHYLSK